MPNNSLGEVFITKTADRNAGVKSLMSRFDLGDFSGRKVALKANFNSADPFPASTHLDTLQAITETLIEARAADVIMGELSGMGNTRRVLEEMGVFELSKGIGFQTVIFDEIPKDD